MKMKYNINKYYEMVHKIAYSKTNNYHDANDLCQEVFLKLLEHQDKFESEEHMKHWLIRVTINTFIKHQTSGWTKNTIYMTQEIRGVLEGTSEAFSYTDSYSFDNDVDETIKALPEKYQEVIYMFYYKNMTIREIMQAKGLGESAVKMQLSRARKILRDCMDSKHLIAKRLFRSLDEQLKQHFKEYEKYAKKNGTLFQRRREIHNIAIVVTDMANGWTKPGHPFSCNAQGVVEEARKICDVARMCEDIPVVFTRTMYNPNGHSEIMLRGNKIPANKITEDNYWTAIDEQLDVKDNEVIITKNCISCFGNPAFETYLKQRNIDTLIIMGLTASGAVRHTVMDAYYRSYNVIVPKTAIADRIPGAIFWNIFDMEMNFAELMSTENVIQLLDEHISIERIS